MDYVGEITRCAKNGWNRLAGGQGWGPASRCPRPRGHLENKILAALASHLSGLGLESAETLSTGAVETGTEKHEPAI
jgi:hypothetical protein